MTKKELGNWGEALVARTLKRRGHEILGKNIASRWAEIDLVTWYQGQLWIVEVKTRTSDLFGAPEEAVTPRKLQKLRLAGTAVAEDFSRRLRVAQVKLVVAAVSLEPHPTVRFFRLS